MNRAKPWKFKAAAGSLLTVGSPTQSNSPTELGGGHGWSGSYIGGSSWISFAATRKGSTTLT